MESCDSAWAFPLKLPDQYSWPFERVCGQTESPSGHVADDRIVGSSKKVVEKPALSVVASASEAGLNTAHRDPSSRWVAAAVIAVALVLALLRWNALPTLLALDPPMWLFQSARFVWGELPYRDFNFNYPPLSVVLLGYWLRWFGVKFWVAALGIDLMGALNLFFFYRLSRRIMPPLATLVTMLFLLGICCTTTTKYGLLAFTTYSPSLLLASLGLVMILDAGVEWIRSGLRRNSMIVLAAGFFVSLVSKPESMITAVGALALLILLNLPSRTQTAGLISSLRFHALLIAACAVPAAAFWVLSAARFGLNPMLEGIQGYGLTGQTCPWWPTGLGIFGGLAALGGAAFVLVVLSWAARRKFREAHRWFRLVEFLAMPGLLIFVAYYWVLTRSVMSEAGSWSRLKALLPLVAGTSPILLMVMWPALLITLYLGIDWLRKRGDVTTQRKTLFLLVSVPSAVALRGLFGTLLSPVTEVSALCYPFFAFLGPYLVWLFTNKVGPGRGIYSPVQMNFAALLLLYAASRLVMAYPDQFRPSHYTTVQTEAGPVRLGDRSGEVYQYIVEHSKAGEPILEFPYGGGFNFAAHRPSPTFSVQFLHLMMSQRLQDRDASQARNNPPAFVIAPDDPVYLTSYGIPFPVKCNCPRLEWMPTEYPGMPGYVYPVVSQVREHYRVEKNFGFVTLLAPVEGARK